MGAVQDVVDAAAHFVGPFMGKGPAAHPVHGHVVELVETALSHLDAINAAEQGVDPNAPYDASLVGIVYGLLDLITSLGILPHLSPGVAFRQRPQSVLLEVTSVTGPRNEQLLAIVINKLIPILSQAGTGVQPLLSQRALPDMISGLAELAFSPRIGEEDHVDYPPVYERIMKTTPTSRLLPVLTSLLQQHVPLWWKSRLSKELAMVPLRPHGVRHIIEFLSLLYLSKNSQVPQDASGPQTQLPLPLEAITQASRLLMSCPDGLAQDEWLTQLAPELLILLDGSEGRELSRAAGQIIAGGILNKRSTGAPGKIGWELFAHPLQLALLPTSTIAFDDMIVSEQELRLSLRRLATLASSYSHAGLMKRLVGPVALSLWGLFSYASRRPSLDREWAELSRSILLRYLTVSCDAHQVDAISNDLFYDGEQLWTFGPGSHGGVEIRQRPHGAEGMTGVESMLSRIGDMDERVNSLTSLLTDANIKDEAAGSIFSQATKKWLASAHAPRSALYPRDEADPLSALVNVKLAEALASSFKEKLARSPTHIIELMDQLLLNFVEEHRTRSKQLEKANRPTRATLGYLVKSTTATSDAETEGETDDLASFTLSILSTLVPSPDFKRTPEINKMIDSILLSLQYLIEPNKTLPISPLIINAANNVIQTIQRHRGCTIATDESAQHRTILSTALADLTSPEPPNRTWALSTLRRLIQDPAAFHVIDAPSLTHTLLSVSIADADSYVHTAAIPVLVDLATRIPSPTVRILIDAFLDIDESSLRLKKEEEVEQALDYRLRVGEILNSIVLDDISWVSAAAALMRFPTLKKIVEATLAIASRRGQRKQTLTKRKEAKDAEQRRQEEGEEAWDGPIPNLLDPHANSPAEQAERESLLKILQGWEDTGVEEDVRIRASALSILSSIMENRLELLGQAMVDASVQMTLLILTMEKGDAKAILRRAAVLVVMGLLRGLDGLLEEGREGLAGIELGQAEEVEKVMRWVGDDDGDHLVKNHALSVLEGIDTWRMKKLYRIRNNGLKLTPDLGLEEGDLRGLEVKPLQNSKVKKRGPVIEEIE